jgi:hypothetical protein
VISFTGTEILWLREQAEKKRTALKTADLHPKRVYEEDRLEFVWEYMRGAEPASHEKQQRWLKRIKRECRSGLK